MSRPFGDRGRGLPVLARGSRLVGAGGDVLERDLTLDILSGKDGLIIPGYEDSNVAWYSFKRHSDTPSNWRRGLINGAALSSPYRWERIVGGPGDQGIEVAIHRAAQ